MSTKDAVLHLVLPWAEDFADPRPGHVAKIARQLDGSLDLNLWLRLAGPDGKPRPSRGSFSVPVRMGDPVAEAETPGAPYKVTAFGLRRIGPGVWVVSPSIWLPGVFHAYVVLHDVPEPPPWEHL